MITVSIDPGTQCGWAVLDPAGNRIASGTWDLSPRRHESAGMRFVKFERSFRDLLNTYPDCIVAYEEVRRHAGTDASHIYGGLLATLQRVCLTRSTVLEHVGVPVGTVKKHATGKGNAPKEAMIAAAEARWGVTMSSDNEADALWVGETWRAGA